MSTDNSITAKNERLEKDLRARAQRKGLLGDDKHAYISGTIRLVGKLRERKAFKNAILAPLAEKVEFSNANAT